MTKEEIRAYIQTHEFQSAKANSAFMVCDLAFTAYAESDQVHGEPYSPVFYYFSAQPRDYFYQIISDDIIMGVGKRIYRDYLVSEKSLKEKMDVHIKLEKELDTLWQAYSEVRGQKKIADYVEFFNKFINTATKWWYYGAIGEDKGDVIRSTLVPEFAKRQSLALSNADSIFNVLSHPEEQTVLNLERELFLNICKKVANKENVDADSARYVKEYFWSKTDFYKAEEITKDSFTAQVHSELQAKGIEGIEEEISSIRSNYHRLHDERLALLNRTPLTPDDRRDLKFATNIILWIDRRKFGMMKHFYYLLTFISDIAKASKISYSTLCSYSVDELRMFLERGVQVEDSVIKERGEGIFCFQDKGKSKQVFLGKDAEMLFQTYLSRLMHGGDIKGQVASRGGVKMVRGVARVLLKPEGHIFNEGDILVTSMTRVEFIPFMRKAKAVVTDEGGIACHAAIVSRELGIPCVIGTKVGTHQIHDGDLVEVDTEKGVVKILKQT